MEDIDDVQEISFELNNGKWAKIEVDPEDDEFEIITPLTPNGVHERIRRMKMDGWTVRQDVEPDFNGYILFKRREDKDKLYE